MQNDPLAKEHWDEAAEAIRHLDELRLKSETEGEGDADRIVEAIALLANTVLRCNQAVAREIVASREQPRKPSRKQTRNRKQPDEVEQQEAKDPRVLMSDLLKLLKEHPEITEKLLEHPLLKENPQLREMLLGELPQEGS